MLTDAQLARIMPNLSASKRALYLPHLNAAMAANGVTSLLRIAAFVAQLAHESGEFRWMEELWGPTPAQRRYEPVGELARKLGNTDPGDGKRFKGRGPIQITGRFNYGRFGKLLGIDLAADPDRATQPDVAFATAGLFWRSNGLNELADGDQFVTITRRINGGTNGLAERQRYYRRAKEVLAEPGGVATRGAPIPGPGLERGYEAIAAEAPMRAARRAGSATAAPKAATAKKATPTKVTPKKATARKATAKKATAKKSTAKARTGTPTRAPRAATTPRAQKITARAATASPAPAKRRAG